MSTSQVAFYTNRVGKFEKMRCNKHCDKQNPEVTNDSCAFSKRCCIHGPVSAPGPSTLIASGEITGNETNTLSTWLHTLEQTGLATRWSGGKLKEWIPKIRSSICATLADETLELPIGSIKFKARPMHPHTGF
jgi:hypothetical protein